MPKYLLIASFLLAFSALLTAQYVPHNVTNTGIYEFLDELANDGLVELNSVIKPYSRMTISEILKLANEQRDRLTARQQKELDFYLKDFGKEFNDGKDWNRRKDLFYYKDDKFTMTVNPILGGEVFSNSNGMATYCAMEPKHGPAMATGAFSHHSGIIMKNPCWVCPGTLQKEVAVI